MDQLPIVLNVTGKKAVVVGGGLIASRKTETLIKANMQIDVFADKLGQDLLQAKKNGAITHFARAIEKADLKDALVGFGASNDKDINLAFYKLAQAEAVPVNIVDDPKHCDFIMPAIVDRSPILITISSGGASPIFTRTLKARFEAMVPKSYGQLAEFAGSYRQLVKEKISDFSNRRRFWEQMLGGSIGERVLIGKEEEAHALTQTLLDDYSKNGDTPPEGEVYLVGAGPGDPDLLTFRALRLMQQCDVILYDRLLGDGILNLVRKDAERIYVGKMSADHTLPQEDISSLLVKLAKEGKRVLRLKAGDPFTFGRGGEEIEALAEAQIPFQIVPGITAASGCATFAGIPLTHRDHAQSCTFITGHSKDGNIPQYWQGLTKKGQTIVIYMGLSNLSRISQAYIENGGDRDIPAAAIENGTRRDQRVITGTIESLPALVEKAALKSPTLIIIGHVVNLHNNLAWYKGDETEDQVPKGHMSIKADKIS
jgi:uroporphyrin-III C-methyltransferase / precorrin-2 dehydrogenase / sirohydrochlorin ferrochelatase